MIKADMHMHSSFSMDSEARPEEMIEAAITDGLEYICLTDHYDKDNFDWGDEGIFDAEEYFKVMPELQENYRDQIGIGIGVEIGLQPYLKEFYREFAKKYPFDFIIGSVHSVRRVDVATKKMFKENVDEKAYRIYLEEMLKNVEEIKDFDVLGHLDYMVRYSKQGVKSYRCEDYMDITDEIFKILIDEGRGIELNMSGFKYGLSQSHPHPELLKRYRELGGEILTIGSDGHEPKHIAYDFHRAKDILENCGFRYYTQFKQRKPFFVSVF